ncbi:MAG: hypothetical protein U0S36_02565 [Candidatus Nanopelagicales bacterium]
MHAAELVVPAPVVRLDDPVLTALQVLLDSGLPGLVVRDGDRHLVVPGSQVLRVALPRYVRDDPSLSRVWDEASADALVAQVAGLTVADLMEALDLDEGSPTTMVGADATTIEVAAVMSAAHVPLVAVLDAGRFMGVVTVEALVAHLVS